MFQKVHKNRPKFEALYQYPNRVEDEKKMEIKTRKSPQENVRKNKQQKDMNNEINKSKDNLTKEKRHTSKSSDKQVNISKDSLQKDSIREEKDASNELRQSNMSHISLRKSDMSNHSRSVKDLSSLDYLRYKRDQSRERGEFYDMGGGVYRNYKYEKLKLQRPEFNFISNKPLDFFGKVLVYNTNKNTTEKALQNIKRQQDILSIGMTDIKDSKLLKENNVYQEIRQKIQNDIINSQERLYPFEGKQKIKKELAKLEKHIKDKNNSSSMTSIIQTLPSNNSGIQNESSIFPSVQSAKGSIGAFHTYNGQAPTGSSPSQTQSRMFSQSTQNIKPIAAEKKWLSPMMRYESYDNLKYKSNQTLISKTDLILKNELLREGQPDHASQKQYRKLFRNKNNHKSHHNEEDDDDENEGVCINVINFNKAFKGRGSKMHSLLQFDEKNPLKNKLTADIVKSFNKKSQHLLIVEEFNRLLQIDRVQQAKKRTKKIKTKMDLKIDEKNLESQIVTLDYCISQEIFLQETFFFSQYIRNEPVIRERLLYGISNQQNGIDFESYLRFYQIFVFQNTPPDVLIQFICKFFILNKESRLAAISLAQFQQTLKDVVNHPSLVDRDQCYQNWEKGLQEQKIFTYDPNTLLRMKHLEQIFTSQVINPNLILKLLFK